MSLQQKIRERWLDVLISLLFGLPAFSILLPLAVAYIVGLTGETGSGPFLSWFIIYFSSPLFVFRLLLSRNHLFGLSLDPGISIRWWTLFDLLYLIVVPFLYTLFQGSQLEYMPKWLLPIYGYGFILSLFVRQLIGQGIWLNRSKRGDLGENVRVRDLILLIVFILILPISFPISSVFSRFFRVDIFPGISLDSSLSETGRFTRQLPSRFRSYFPSEEELNDRSRSVHIAKNLNSTHAHVTSSEIDTRHRDFFFYAWLFIFCVILNFVLVACIIDVGYLRLIDKPMLIIAPLSIIAIVSGYIAYMWSSFTFGVYLRLHFLFQGLFSPRRYVKKPMRIALLLLGAIAISLACCYQDIGSGFKKEYSSWKSEFMDISDMSLSHRYLNGIDAIFEEQKFLKEKQDFVQQQVYFQELASNILFDDFGNKRAFRWSEESRSDSEVVKYYHPAAIINHTGSLKIYHHEVLKTLDSSFNQLNTLIDELNDQFEIKEPLNAFGKDKYYSIKQLGERILSFDYQSWLVESEKIDTTEKGKIITTTILTDSLVCELDTLRLDIDSLGTSLLVRHESDSLANKEPLNLILFKRIKFKHREFLEAVDRLVMLRLLSINFDRKSLDEFQRWEKTNSDLHKIDFSNDFTAIQRKLGSFVFLPRTIGLVVLITNFFLLVLLWIYLKYRGSENKLRSLLRWEYKERQFDNGRKASKINQVTLSEELSQSPDLEDQFVNECNECTDRYNREWLSKKNIFSLILLLCSLILPQLKDVNVQKIDPFNSSWVTEVDRWYLPTYLDVPEKPAPSFALPEIGNFTDNSKSNDECQCSDEIYEVKKLVEKIHGGCEECQ